MDTTVVDIEDCVCDGSTLSVGTILAEYGVPFRKYSSPTDAHDVLPVVPSLWRNDRAYRVNAVLTARRLIGAGVTDVVEITNAVDDSTLGIVTPHTEVLAP